MLQRIQTIWILLSILSAVFLFITGQDAKMFGDLPIIDALSIILVLIGALSLFGYKNRNRQILLNKVSIIINALLIGLLIYWLQILPGGIDFPEKGIEPIFPAIAIVTLLIANIYLKKDERLVKSVDRIR
ncbi:DUF4293 family protein [Chryseobacterium sp.]|uniref:DUF4293 family protein n=1 Tax=Chryseobacterium sp. TaxID=1871047 RepID=UPI00388F07D9